MSRARYTIQTIDNLIVILDANDGAKSVTNDADNIVQDLVRLGHNVDRKVIVYRDTMGNWDQITTNSARFATFYPLKRPSAHEEMIGSR